MKKRRWALWLAGALLLAAFLAVLGGLFRLSQPNTARAQIVLNYTAADTHGWSFETEEGPAEPVLDDGGYLLGIPMETAGPLAATRIMEDTGELDLLQLDYAGVGIQVFLDGKLLYTDFPGMDNRIDVFLEDADTEDISKSLLLSLPVNCAGQELRIVTYGPSWDGYRHSVVPVLTSRFSDADILVSDSVRFVATITGLALLALFLLLMFLLGVFQGQRQWNLLPLAAYFLLATVPLTMTSFVSSAAGLDSSQPLLHWIKLSYIDGLMVFLTIELKSWRRWLLLAGTAAHALLSLTWVVWGVPPLSLNLETTQTGLALLALAAVLLALSWREKAIFRWGLISFCAAAVIMFAAWAANQIWGPMTLYPLANPVAALLVGDSRGFYTILCAVASALSVAWVAREFVRNTLDRHKREQALQMSHRLIQESYQAAEEKLRRNAAMRHEWKNQVAALRLLQQQGDLERLSRYLEELDCELDRLAPQQYSDHFAINTILQSAAARAESLGVAFHASAPVPSELGVDTGDLCELLLNMLDNALEAAAQVPDPDAREVEYAIKVRQGYLAIKCENTYAGKLALDEHGQFRTTKADQEGHGFGIAKMKSIAEKYGSVLDISYTDGRFIVQTALKL